LTDVPLTFHIEGMSSLDSHALSEAILAAPAWALIGVTMPDERMRLRAADELARAIMEQLEQEGVAEGLEQLVLPI
jgi:2C-methyl-D-erythritol 2,4-cyclodiphosphate synthase